MLLPAELASVGAMKTCSSHGRGNVEFLQDECTLFHTCKIFDCGIREADERNSLLNCWNYGCLFVEYKIVFKLLVCSLHNVREGKGDTEVC